MAKDYLIKKAQERAYKNAKNISTYSDLHSEPSERAIIGSLLIDKEAIEEVADFLKPEHFYLEANQDIYRACLELYNSNKPIDLVTLTDQLKANKKLAEIGTAYIAECVNEVPTAIQIKIYATTVVDYAVRRRVAEAVEDIKTNIYDEKKDTAQTITQVENILLQATQQPDRDRLEPDTDKLSDFLGEIENRKENNKKGGFVGLDIGFKHLNEVALGLQTGLWIIGARPSLGKTTFIRQLIDQVAMNNPETPCLFVSYEQSGFELMLKTISRFAKVNSRDIQKGRLSEKEEEQMHEAIGKYSNHASRIYIYEADGARTTTETIKAKARQLLKHHNAKRVFIAIDYLQLLPLANGLSNKTDKERIDRACSDLRRLARDLDSPVVAVSSLNRPSYNKGGKADLASFKESGGIEYSADLAMTMEEDKQASEILARQKGAPAKVVSLNIHKNRNGERARIIFEFDMPTATFNEIDKKQLEEDKDTFT